MTPPTRRSRRERPSHDGRTVAAQHARVLALPAGRTGGADDGDRHEHARGAAAQGEGSPLAALLLDGRLPGSRDPDHRARRGPVPLRHARQALPGHAQRPVHRADRLLVRRGARPGRARADAAAAVLHELDVRAPARGRARGPARRARAAEHQPRVLRLRRLRGGRVGLEAGAPVPRRQRPADAAQGHRAQGRLPRHDDGRALDHRHHVDPHAVRAARRRRPPRREHEPLPLQVLRGGRRVLARVRRRGGRDDRAGGPRDGRDGDHGARPELGRHVHPAPGVPPPRARDLRRLRRPAGRRRGHLRLRPAGRVVRLPALRLRARPDHVRQGPDERLRVARRRC